MLGEALQNYAQWVYGRRVNLPEEIFCGGAIKTSERRYGRSVKIRYFMYT